MTKFSEKEVMNKGPKVRTSTSLKENVSNIRGNKNATLPLRALKSNCCT